MRLHQIILVALAHLALVAAFTVVTPLGDAPDEGAHLAYLQYVMDHGERPPRDWLHEWPHTYEAHQHPLYYWTSASLLKFAGIDSVAWSHEQQGGYGLAESAAQRSFPVLERERWDSDIRAMFAARATTWGWSVLMVLALCVLAGNAASSSKQALLAVMPFALSPQLAYLGGVVNNDVPAIALVAIAVAGMSWVLVNVPFVHRPAGVNPAVLITAFAAAAAPWAKITGVVVVAPLAVTLIILSRHGHRGLVVALAGPPLLSFVAGGLALWFGHDLAVPSFAAVEHDAPLLRDLARLLTEPFWVIQIWTSFWGLFGYFSYNLPVWLLAIWLPVSLLVGVGVALLFAHSRTDPQAAVLVALLSTNAALWLGVMVAVSWQPQGRYFFISVPVFVVALAAALEWCRPKIEGWLFVACLAPWPLAAALAVTLWGMHANGAG